MEEYSFCTIKSFKHDGSLHRTWLENWRVPPSQLDSVHVREKMIVTINDETRVRESSGKEWISKVPGVAFFIPETWYNIVALIDDDGIRYYCNIASPPYEANGVITYIDYDLNVIVRADGRVHVVDQDEYERNRRNYRYNRLVTRQVEKGLDELLKRIDAGCAPFDDGKVLNYYRHWKRSKER